MGLPRRFLLMAWLLPGLAASVPARAAPDTRAWRLQAGDGSLQLLDGDGRVRKSWPARSADGRRSGQPASLMRAEARRSLVVSFDALPELWEISLDPQAEDLYQGLVHDFRMGEGVPEPGFLGVRRTRLPVPLPQAVLDGSGSWLLGRAADEGGRAVLHLVHLDVRRSVRRFEVAADPDMAGARHGFHHGRPVILLPDRRGGPGLRVDPDALTIAADD
jgi:hypothetical protein